VSNDLLKYLSDKVDGELAVIEGELALGKCKDFATYQYTCGIYRGLLTAKNIITETSERMDYNDE
tara:strand:- start:1407 stop:1601 length:195 start_codon:yes stop_codon:yes gene_type:complete